MTITFVMSLHEEPIDEFRYFISTTNTFASLAAPRYCSFAGRRLLTGNFQGEFCLWDGNTYQFELIMSAHDDPFRCMCWSPNNNFLITTSSRGNLKYWR